MKHPKAIEYRKSERGKREKKRKKRTGVGGKANRTKVNRPKRYLDVPRREKN